MNCSCRTSSLRIFVQSLTQLPLAGTASRSGTHLHHRSLGRHQRNGSARSFTAASVACYPRHTLRAPVLNTTPQRLRDGQSDDISNCVSGQSHTSPCISSLAADASARDLEQAKSNGAIFDFSPEAIDALAADLQRTPIEDPGSRVDAGSSTRSRPAQTGESNRLRRSKIMPSIKKFEVRSELPPRKKEPWQIQKAALKEKFPEGWAPRKRLSPDALEGIRALHTQYPEEYTTPVLAEKFQVSAEAIRRILRAKWTPTADQEISRQERWFNRGKNIWSQMAELGTKPPKKWREEGIVRDPRFNKKKGPRTEYPYQPRRQPEEDHESTQRKLGGSLL